MPGRSLALVVVLLAAGCGRTAADEESFIDPDMVPRYEGPVDLPWSIVWAGCTVDQPEDVEDGGTGEFHVTVEVTGWAASCWVELHASDGSYCEGTDPGTGDPCTSDGVERPGWTMEDEDYGWNAAEGHWDQWALDLPYHGGIWPPEDEASLFVCEQAGPDLQVWLCCSDAVDPAVESCVEVPW